MPQSQPESLCKQVSHAGSAICWRSSVTHRPLLADACLITAWRMRFGLFGNSNTALAGSPRLEAALSTHVSPSKKQKLPWYTPECKAPCQQQKKEHQGLDQTEQGHQSRAQGRTLLSL